MRGHEFQHGAAKSSFHATVFHGDEFRVPLTNFVEQFFIQRLGETHVVMAGIQAIAAKIAAGDLGPHARGLTSLRVALHESHVAWAAYEAKLGR